MFEGDIGGALLSAAERHAERPALWAGGKHLTYAELFDQAAGIAGAIGAAGVPPGERVAILSRRTPTAYAGILGALLAGCTYIPLNTQFPRERNQAMLRGSEARALVVDESSASKLDNFLDPLDLGLAVVRPEFGDDSLPDIGGRPAPLGRGEGAAFWRSVRRPVDPARLAYILFTSGTTGKPKGVPISHLNLSAYLDAISRVGPLSPDDRILQMAKLTFDLSVHDMFLSWLNGAEIFSMPDSAELLAPRLITQHKLTGCLVVPSAATRMLEQGLAKPNSMPSLRISYFCGEALPRSVAEAWKEAAPNSRIINIYGPTECTVVVCAYDYRVGKAPDLTTVPVGRLFGDQQLKLFTPEMAEAAPGETGEICIAGSQVMDGYWRDPGLNAEKFVVVDGVRWFRSGDLGRWVEPHGLLFAGRTDRQVKIRGYRVELQEIEGTVRRVTGRQQVAVIPWPVNAHGMADGSVAFVCGDETEASAIRAGCRAIVADYMVPDRVVFVPELPVNVNGKVDYRELAQHPSLSA